MTVGNQRESTFILHERLQTLELPHGTARTPCDRWSKSAIVLQKDEEEKESTAAESTADD